MFHEPLLCRNQKRFLVLVDLQNEHADLPKFAVANFQWRIEKMDSVAYLEFDLKPDAFEGIRAKKQAECPKDGCCA